MRGTYNYIKNIPNKLMMSHVEIEPSFQEKKSRPGVKPSVISCRKRAVVPLTILEVHSEGVDVLTPSLMRSEASRSPPVNGQNIN